MMDEFMKLLAKKAKEQKGPMHGPRMHAKAAMAKELSDSLGSDIMDGIGGMKKVTVASNSEKGLKEGLEKAEDVLESKMKKEDEESDSEEEMEDSEEEDMDDEEESSSDLESEIAELEKELEDKKKALKLKR
jgi:TATA-binding protein-associated factor Taf7